MTNSSTALVHSLPFTWRVSRYDPGLRDAHGRYVDETWTSIADVGNVFEGRELTLSEYEEVEAAYLDVFRAFAEEAAIDGLEVREVESDGGRLDEGTILSVNEAREVVRSMLREEVVCKLETPTDDFYLHVGFDLYMYVGADQACPNAAAYAAAAGLHAEPDWPSPQLG